MPALKWDKKLCNDINAFIRSGMTYPEISKATGIPVNNIRASMQKRGFKNQNYQKTINKHSHLREKAMTFFLTNTFEETRKKFKLTQSEMKSLFTLAYRMDELKHLRKDTRRRDKWSPEEIRTMLMWSGILPRKEIALMINRGNERVIKEKLSLLGISSRNVNGMNICQFRKTFGNVPVRLVRTRAGPLSNFHFSIILWIDIKEMIDCNQIAPSKTFCEVVEIMSMFQKFVWGNKNIRAEILKKLGEK